MIKKSECLARLAAREETEYKEFVQIIDQELNGYDYKPISITVPKNISNRVVERIVTEYSMREVGWTVERKLDSKDSEDYLVFS